MVFSVSPSVKIREVDATASIPPTATGIGAIAGPFHWGPTNERVLVTSESNLVSRFGKPSDFNPETFFTAADFLAYSNALYVVRTSDGGAAANNATMDAFVAKYEGTLGNSLEVSYVTNTASYSSQLWAIGGVTAPLTFGSTSISFISGPAIDLKAGDILRLGNTTSGFQNIPILTIDEIVIDVSNSTYNITSTSRYNLIDEDMATLSGERLWGYSASVSTGPVVDSFHMVVADKDGEISGVAGTVLEVYEDLSTTVGAKLGDGTSNYYRDVIDARSAWIANDQDTVDTDSDAREYALLINGADGNGESNSNFGAVALGYDLFKNADEVDVSFVMQGKAKGGADFTGIGNYIIGNVTEYRKDCVAFISPALNDTVGVGNDEDKLNNVLGYRASMQASTYSFVDTGYKYRYDKYNDQYRWTPLNGDTAGLAARVDPWVSPAGYRRGGVKNVVKLAYNPNKEHRDQLYGKNINSVITQSGSGTILFGDKTGLGIHTSAFNFLNVRRLFITVEKVIASASKFELFELNNESTQARFKNMVEPYLRDIQGKDGIIDFRVVVDATVNTPDIIDAGKFRANIFIKPARSIQEIELTFIATRTGVEFSEIVGQSV